MKKAAYFLPLIVLSIIVMESCSSSEQTTKKEEEKTDEDVYIFDEVPPDTTIDIDETQPGNDIPPLNTTYYKVQIGAFTTKEKADEFATTSRTKLQEDLDISYSEEVNLFVVQLKPSFKSKEDAEKVRNQLWQTEEYKDAWIVTINK